MYYNSMHSCIMHACLCSVHLKMLAQNSATLKFSIIWQRMEVGMLAKSRGQGNGNTEKIERVIRILDGGFDVSTAVTRRGRSSTMASKVICELFPC